MLLDKIDADLITALKTGNEPSKEILRSIKSAVKYLKVDQEIGEITDDHIALIIKKEIKRHQESITAFTIADRLDLAEKEKQELVILESYLPKQMTEEEIIKQVNGYLSTHPTTIQEFGRAMKELSNELKNKADLGLVSKILRDSVK